MSRSDMSPTPRNSCSIGLKTVFILAVILTVSIFLGCMSLSIGEHKHLPGEATTGVLTQEGTLHLQPGSEQDVYYPIPFAQPPNLELEDDHNDYQLCVIQDQKSDRFRIAYPALKQKGNITITWKARGLRVSPPTADIPAPATSNQPSAVPTSSNQLPPTPTPVH